MNFKYKAKDKYGKAVAGVMAAGDSKSVAAHLSAMGYAPISIEETAQTGGGFARSLSMFRKKVPKRDLGIFTRQLLTLQKAGIPLMTSLEALARQTKNKQFSDIIREVAADVEEGAGLSDALAKHSEIFNELYVNMVRAGEAGGALDEVLGRLVEFGEKELDTRAQLAAATRYPMITFGALVCAFVIMVTFVIPQFAGIYSSFKAKLPLPTRMMLGISHAMRSYRYIILAAVTGMVTAFRLYVNSPGGRVVWDGLKLKLPVFGPLISLFVISRFARTMSILLKSGLPILQVLSMSARTVGNVVIARVVENIAMGAKEGKGIAEPMRISGVFPPMVISMVSIGEESGKLDELLMKVSEYYDQQADYMVKNFSTLIEPIFVLVLGVMVLSMALAIFLPMWSIFTLFKS